VGTVIGVQFAAVFQSPEVGLAFHVALPAMAVLELDPRSNSPAEMRFRAELLEKAELLRVFIGTGTAAWWFGR
jgi:hypothetical protein